MLIWPRLWLVLPDTARQETGQRPGVGKCVCGSSDLGYRVRAFAPLTWWALLGPAIAVAAVLWWVPARAEDFADLLEATVELYRVALYRQPRWPLPKNSAAERDRGEALTKYLERGSDKPYPLFTPPS